MSSFGPRPRRRHLVLGVGATLAAMLMAAPGASAQFTLAECAGSAAPGRGASFQNTAFTGFRNLYTTEGTGCGSAANGLLTYDAAGSGAGRRAFGERSAPNTNGDRDPNIRWIGSDEPPTQSQRDQMEKGPIVPGSAGVDLTAADNNPIHVVPVAIGAIAILAHLPTGCTSYGATGNDLFRDRPKTSLTALEDVFRGTATTWGDLIPTLEPNTAACRQAPIQRLVRRDSSGTTFALRQLLAKIDPANAADWKTRAGGVAWPNQATAPVLPGDADGGSSLTDKGIATPGTLGYVDLATARARGSQAYTWDAAQAIDRTFWLPLQSSTTDTGNYFDPQSDAQGYKLNNAARGANCSAVDPTGVPNSTLGDWSAADSTMSEDGYAACTLTYDLLFDDPAVVYCKSAAEEAKARTVKDYFTKAVVSAAGQNTLARSDYGRVPGTLIDTARAGVAAIGWNKGGAGRPCGDEQPPPVATPTPTPTGPGTTPPPPPAPPSNNVTVPSTRAVGTTIRLSLQLPGAGKVSITSSAKPKKGKAVTLAAKTVNVTKAGAQTVTLSLNAKAKSALRKDKKLKFTLKITYTPTGGTAKTVTKTITVKQPKKSTK